MLVLKRRKGEEIWINDEIRIVIAQASDKGCTIAIDAPAHYRIRRAELMPLDDLPSMPLESQPRNGRATELASSCHEHDYQGLVKH